MSQKLSHDLLKTHEQQRSIMTNALLATCFLTYGEKEMTFSKAKKNSKDIQRLIASKNTCKSFVSEPPQNKTIQRVAKNLGLSISGKPLDRKFGDNALVRISQHPDRFKSLSYYSMPVRQALCLESILANALFFHQGTLKNETQAISIVELTKTARVLQ